MIFNIDPKICPQNHVCPLVDVCPADAIHQDREGLPVFDEEQCIKCGKCLRRGPKQAVIKT